MRDTFKNSSRVSSKVFHHAYHASYFVRLVDVKKKELFAPTAV